MGSLFSFINSSPFFISMTIMRHTTLVTHSPMSDFTLDLNPYSSFSSHLYNNVLPIRSKILIINFFWCHDNGSTVIESLVLLMGSVLGVQPLTLKRNKKNNSFLWLLYVVHYHTKDKYTIMYICIKGE